jgi:hypothetical protein
MGAEPGPPEQQQLWHRRNGARGNGNTEESGRTGNRKVPTDCPFVCEHSATNTSFDHGVTHCCKKFPQ